MTETQELIAALRIGDPGSEHPDWEVIWVQNLRAMLERGTFSSFRNWHAIFLQNINELLLASSEAASALEHLVAERDAAVAAEREACAQIAERDVDWTAFIRRPKTDALTGGELNVHAPSREPDDTMPTDANVFAYVTGIDAGSVIASTIRARARNAGSGEQP